MTMNGKINASFITTGELDAAVIKTGSITADKLSISAQQVLIQAVKVGGTNLLADSEKERTSASEYIGVGIYAILEANPGKELTFSFEAKSSIAGDFTVYSLGDYDIGSRGVSLTTAFQRFSFTFTPVKVGTAGWCDWSWYGVYGTGKLPTLRRLQIEIGNVATDWSPAPADKVGTNEIVSKINLTPEAIKIQASKISLEGLVTVNNNFKVLEDGSIEGTNAKMSGTISATKIVSPSNGAYYGEIGSVGGFVGLALYDTTLQAEAYFEVLENALGSFYIRDKNNINRISAEGAATNLYDEDGNKQIALANGNTVIQNDFSATRAIRNGTVTLNKDTSTSVTFPAMQGTPSIALTPVSSYSGVVVTAKITAVSSTGFSAIIQGTPVTSATFHWIAIAPDTSA
jgi:hypothetical protein